MSETLLFKIPTPSLSQDTPLYVNWYQSTNGIVWGQPIDTVQILDLEVDSASGKYIWHSDLATEYMYNQLKTVSVNGIESDTGIILPPKPKNIIDTTPSDVYAQKIGTDDKTYNIGETIEFLLEIEEEIADIIGEKIEVFLVDIFGNTIDNVQANLISSSLYCAEWKIPKKLIKLYNIENKEDPYDSYILYEKWMLPSNTSLTFEIKVSKSKIEQPITDNSTISISINDIESNDGLHTFDNTVIRFTTKLEPFYADVDDVRVLNKEYIDKFDNFEIAKELLSHSMHVDLTLKPNKIERKDAYDFAVNQWVAYDTALSLISAGALNTVEETKEIDTLKISKKRNEKGSVLHNIRENLEIYEKIILGGGLDTPFKSKTFVKGIYDPNRTQLSRSGIDNNDPFPYVNSRISSFNIQDNDGNIVEVRGIHTVGYRNLSYDTSDYTSSNIES